MRGSLALVKSMLYVFIALDIQHKDKGLCWVRLQMWTHGYLTDKENERLKILLSNNRPKLAISNPYWFYNDKDRVFFLQTLIDKLGGAGSKHPRISKKGKKIIFEDELPF